MTSSIDNRGTKKEERLRKRRNRYQKFQKELARAVLILRGARLQTRKIMLF